MKSICIKSNNVKLLNYLQLEFENSSLNKYIVISIKDFKYYNNLILHYIGNNIPEFYNSFCEIFINMILKFYEKKKLKELININYFYFSEFERQSILNNCITLLKTDDLKRETANNYLYTELLKYIIENRNIFVDGFINFRLYNYMNLLDDIINESVNSYIIEKEYNEFIDLLKVYIKNKESSIDVIHLIYMNGDSILIDDQKNIVSVDDNILNATYLSDISFSSNDFTLNTLLCIIPKKIIIHIIDSEDDFINTLKLIFEKRIEICCDCNICNIYKNISEHIISKNK